MLNERVAWSIAAMAALAGIIVLASIAARETDARADPGGGLSDDGAMELSRRPPSEDECRMLRRAAEATFQAMRDSELQASSGQSDTARASNLSELDAAIDQSRRWFDEGCPEHPRLGIFEYPDGRGAEVRLIDWPPSNRATWFGTD
jgi:hypothetical protein